MPSALTPKPDPLGQAFIVGYWTVGTGRKSKMKRPLVIFFLSVLVFAGCSKNESELQKQEKLHKELLESRRVNLSKKLSLESAVLVEQEKELQSIADAFMKGFSTGQLFTAFSEIQKFTPWPPEEFDAIKKQTSQQIAMLKPRYGDFIGYEFVEAKRPSPSVTKLLYLAKCENHALRCTFIFYRPKDKWFLNMFKWDDKLHLLE